MIEKLMFNYVDKINREYEQFLLTGIKIFMKSKSKYFWVQKKIYTSYAPDNFSACAKMNISYVISDNRPPNYLNSEIWFFTKDELKERLGDYLD